jgi:hypothetical protein
MQYVAVPDFNVCVTLFELKLSILKFSSMKQQQPVAMELHNLQLWIILTT